VWQLRISTPSSLYYYYDYVQFTNHLQRTQAVQRQSISQLCCGKGCDWMLASAEDGHRFQQNVY